MPSTRTSLVGGLLVLAGAVLVASPAAAVAAAASPRPSPAAFCILACQEAYNLNDFTKDIWKDDPNGTQEQHQDTCAKGCMTGAKKTVSEQQCFDKAPETAVVRGRGLKKAYQDGCRMAEAVLNDLLAFRPPSADEQKLCDAFCNDLSQAFLQHKCKRLCTVLNTDARASSCLADVVSVPFVARPDEMPMICGYYFGKSLVVPEQQKTKLTTDVVPKCKLLCHAYMVKGPFEDEVMKPIEDQCTANCEGYSLLTQREVLIKLMGDVYGVDRSSFIPASVIYGAMEAGATYM